MPVTDTPLSGLSPAQLQSARQRLKGWYASHGRDGLPWRRTSDPYHVYVSEVMLQQTQVATVEAHYYRQFLEQFPSLKALAAAPRDKVLKAWEGLGYYRRARYLHDAANQAGDKLPDTLEGLLALPGIGRNTAHAILALGFRKPYAVMEANVKRVLHRVFAWETASDAMLWQAAAMLLDTADPFTYNQAMMDVGSMVCTPTNPHCNACPLNRICQGNEQPLRYPAKKQKTALPVRMRRIVVVMDKQGKLYLAPRKGAFLHGLHGFPETGADATSIAIEGSELSLAKATSLGSVTQTYSHFQLQAKVIMVEYCMPANARSYSMNEIDGLALSKADHKVLALVKDYSARRRQKRNKA